MIGLGVSIVQTAVRSLIGGGAVTILWSTASVNNWNAETDTWETFQ